MQTVKYWIIRLTFRRTVLKHGMNHNARRVNFKSHQSNNWAINFGNIIGNGAKMRFEYKRWIFMKVKLTFDLKPVVKIDKGKYDKISISYFL
jgi:hypothetical protein